MTPRAARRLSREAATQGFERAAAALNEDWGTALDGKQVQRWSHSLGRGLVEQREAEIRDHERGHYPAPPAHAPALLVLGMDGGRVQYRELDSDSKSRWHEDKILTATTYQPGDGSAEHPPKPLVTTYQATMGKTESFGRMVRVEAERRGLGRAETVLVIGDGGNWIDPLAKRELLSDQRIVDYYHAAEHLHEAAAAVFGKGSSGAAELAEQLKGWLWGGQVGKVIDLLAEHSKRLGAPREQDRSDHPRRVLANNVGYFGKHRDHMDYPRYRAKGWPVGSGVTEAGVKQFNKRVKGTEQFWTEEGVESILALRSLWLSQDGRWNRHWETRPAYLKAA